MNRSSNRVQLIQLQNSELSMCWFDN